MDGLGLCLNDLSLHGHGRDMVMAGWQHNSRLLSFTLEQPFLRLTSILFAN